MSRKTRVDITYSLVERGQKTMLKEREPLDIQRWYSILGEAVGSIGEDLRSRAWAIPRRKWRLH